ncbi:hypothetical protein EV198_2084 [Roseivirga ehrenbergii]|uniref:Uncharacterized protein n=1 Tax=Roseivirga ehrenbergii (strain DSM 102268 / JCM 13514 / KCTC 12282 / NCIMB 14502 / KMM 6017) TaxID=279360 RepID=A0A150WYU9_ROSEK|nr:hypothetical protein MB14_10090 [Roseivirga ehrenbergii]TCL07651.1 hypothetical protein EV198_2084 [Roseivirga ehrenbergii]
MGKRLVNLTKVEIGTAAIFFHKKQTETSLTNSILKSNLKAISWTTQKETIQNHSPFHNSDSSSNKSNTFFRTTNTKTFFSAHKINKEIIHKDSRAARCITKANNYITNLTIKMPMTEPITTTPMTRYCSRAPWSYKLCLTKTQLYL